MNYGGPRSLWDPAAKAAGCGHWTAPWRDEPYAGAWDGAGAASTCLRAGPARFRFVRVVPVVHTTSVHDQPMIVEIPQLICWELFKAEILYQVKHVESGLGRCKPVKDQVLLLGTSSFAQAGRPTHRDGAPGRVAAAHKRHTLDPSKHVSGDKSKENPVSSLH